MLRPVLARQERQRGRKLQTPTFRDKRAAANVYRGLHESSDDRGKLRIETASADAFGAFVRVGGPAVHNGHARFLLTRNTGAALGLHP